MCSSGGKAYRPDLVFLKSQGTLKMKKTSGARKVNKAEDRLKELEKVSSGQK